MSHWRSCKAQQRGRSRKHCRACCAAVVCKSTGELSESLCMLVGMCRLEGLAVLAWRVLLQY